MLDNQKTPIVVALGYFDSVHVGHQKVISTAVQLAKDLGVKSGVVTFNGNLKKALGQTKGKYVFDKEERQTIIKNLGADEVLFLPITKTFLSKGKLAFLNLLNTVFDVKGYVTGEDYRFGKGGKGDVQYIKRYAKNHDQIVKVVKAVKMDDEIVSTTSIKMLLADGNIEKANRFLGYNYFVKGKVFADRQVGEKIGFPTANIKIDGDRAQLKNGVYIGKTTINGKAYKTLINYGGRPTFNLNDRLVETHIIDFKGDLYGQTLTITFTKFLRDIIKFDSVERLKDQLKIDVATILGEDL